MAYGLPGSMPGASKAGGIKGVATGPGKGVQTSNPYTTSVPGMQSHAPAPAPAPKPYTGDGGGAPTLGLSPVLTPAPTTPPSGIPPSMAGLSAAGGTGDALNGPTSGPLRQDLSTRQPPSLAALLQGLRY
jgi:hypothetical protein